MIKTSPLLLLTGISLMAACSGNTSVDKFGSISGADTIVNTQKPADTVVSIEKQQEIRAFTETKPLENNKIENNGSAPRDGTYTYFIAFEESPGSESLGVTCTVVIKGDNIRVISNGGERLKSKKGDMMAEGKIMQHHSGKWIIAENTSDVDAAEVGWCTGGPKVIDFKQKIFFVC